MRFADSWLRVFFVGVLAALASGCTLFTGPERTAPPPAAEKAAPRQSTVERPKEAPAPAKPQAQAQAPAQPAATQNAAAPAAGAVAPAEPAPPPVEPEVPLHPDVLLAFENARRALIAGRLDEAERGFKALTRSHPDLGGPHANLGLVYRRKQMLDESVVALERAVEANPKQAVYFNQLGIAYRMVGQFAKARAAYEKAIELDPNYALAHLNLGILYDVYLWDSRRALELYDRYLSLSPGGDDKVRKWATDLRNREKPRSLAARKEQG